MGNNCIGPKLGSNGFLQSVTAAIWRTRPAEDRLPPPPPPPPPPKEENSTKSGEGSKKSDQQSPHTPPVMVKMTAAPEKVVDRELSIKAKPLDHEKSIKAAVRDVVVEKPVPVEEPKPVPVPVEVPKPVEEPKPVPTPVEEPKPVPAPVEEPKPEPVPVEEPKPKKPTHIKRVSSAALQMDSVLGRKTANLKDLFTLGRKLGQGQFGTTFLCLEKGTGREFACKSIAKRKLTTQEDVEDVRREIQIMHHLEGHPNVIKIVDAYEDAVAVHVVMELCAGGELFDRIIQRGHYTERQAAELARLIVGVVEACHSLGVMHRDLKPENFLFVDHEEDAGLKTIDFGLSVFFKPGETFSDVVGSPYYVAPEVLKKHYGQQCDVWSAGVIIYILLSGVPPFWDESEQGIFEQVLKGELDFTSDPWPNVSESAKDLVRKMLVREPSKRLTAHEVLSHPWVQADGIAPDKPLDPAVLSRLKQFSAMNKIKKIAIRVIAESLSEEEIAGLKEMFKMMDTDNSGQISMEELKNGLERVGAFLKDSEIVKLMEAADVDNSGTIDYGEFIAAMLHLNKIEKEDHLFAAFSYFDKDGSGYITLDELQQACVDFGLGDAHLADIIREVDQDNDGRIDYSEFVAMMQDNGWDPKPK